MNIINGSGWQQLASNPLQNATQAGTEQTAQFRTLVAAGNAAAQQQYGSNTDQHNADNSREEAFAKLKVQLQNLDFTQPKQADSAESEAPAISAAQEFSDYMALSPAEKIKLKLLGDLGITQEEFDAMPPEEQLRIERKIAEQMKKETELDSLAKLNAHMPSPAVSTAIKSGENADPLA